MSIRNGFCLETLESRTLLAGDGLSTIIFDNDNFTGQNITRIDATLNSAWSTNPPASGFGADTFSVRWAGEVKPAQSGLHTFRLDRDGGVRLWVDDQLLIDSWSDQTNIVTAPAVQLTAGKRHRLVVEYRDVSGSARVKLEWNRPGMSSGTYETVPQSVLHSGDRNLAAISGNLGWTNVKSYGAVGDGITDDTTAIRNAMAAGKRIFFPNGTYLVTDKLVMSTSTSDARYEHIQGQNRDNTVIKLADAAANYASAGSPRPVITFFDSTTVHNQAFRNSIHDLTINVGKDNPGAIGLAFHNSNQGGIFNVTVRSEPDAGGARDGHRGVSLDNNSPGPGMMRNVLIDGFATGLYVGHYDHGFVYDDVTFENQSTVAVGTFQNQLFMRNITARNIPRFYQDTNSAGSLILLESDISGSGSAGISIGGRAFIRNTSIDGFTLAVDRVSGTDLVDDSTITNGEWLTTSVKSAFGSDFRPTTLGLEVKDAPVPDDVAPSNWVVVDGSASDDTQAIRDAIALANSQGRTTLVFRADQTYRISDTIEFTGNIQHVLGNEATIDPAGSIQNTNKPVFRFTALTAPSIVFERFATEYPENGNSLIWFEHDTTATVSLQHLTPRHTDPAYTPTITFRNTASGTGDVFINDVSGLGWRFAHGVKVWARNLNPESRYSGSEATNIVVDNATFWAMNVKTEGPNIVIDARNDAKVELLGGRLEPYTPAPSSTTPAFKVTNARASLIFSEGSSTSYTIRVQETRGSTTNNYSAAPWFYSAAPKSVAALSATYANASGTYNLTSEGAVDWAKWGRSALYDFDRKASGGGRISNWTAIGGPSLSRSYNNAVRHSWTDGSPTTSASNNNGYVRAGGANKGFEFTVSAEAGIARTLKLYIGGQYGSTGKLELLLDDGSVTPINLNLTSGSHTEYVVTVNFTADINTNLRVRWTNTTSTGNVLLRAATLA